jgi:hypothetical protein
MAELGNCAPYLQPFHDSAQHTCKGCGCIPRFFAPSVPGHLAHRSTGRSWGPYRTGALLILCAKCKKKKTYPNTPLSEIRATDAYVRTHGLVDDGKKKVTGVRVEKSRRTTKLARKGDVLQKLRH